MSFVPDMHPHRRLNALTGEWILVSPHRTQRPWQGARESGAPDNRPAYDPQCYLCPGNKRAGDAVNPQYVDTFVFRNDFAALLPDTPGNKGSSSPLFTAEPVRGECRVICFSPRHDLTLPELPVENIRRVVEVWANQVADLGQKYRWVQVFENKGSVMGCSNPHPHGQVWASSFIPHFIAAEDARQRDYAQTRERPLLLDYIHEEIAKGARVIEENEHWVGLVPYWATWPYELLLVPRRHVLRLPDLDDGERSTLAAILRRLTTRYDNLFETSFPYSMGWHGAPNDSGDYSHWHLHAHFFPPLLRSATVKKFMVGYEMLAEPQRDLTPEQAATRLKELPTTHYKQQKQQ